MSATSKTDYLREYMERIFKLATEAETQGDYNRLTKIVSGDMYDLVFRMYKEALEDLRDLRASYSCLGEKGKRRLSGKVLDLDYQLRKFIESQCRMLNGWDRKADNLMGIQTKSESGGN